MIKRLVFALALLAGMPALAAGPTLSAGALKLYINSSGTVPCHAGDNCIWLNSSQSPQLRLANGTDIGLGGSSLATNSNPGAQPQLAAIAGAVPVDTGSNSQTQRRLTLDDVDAAFGITSFSTGTGLTVEVGGTISSPVNFTASYTSTPSAAHIDDGINSTVTLTTPFTSGTESHSYTKTVPNQTVVWTITAVGATTKTASITARWPARVYYGVQTPGTINSAFVAGLPSSALQSGFAATYSMGAGGGTKKAYLFFPDSYGTPSTFKDASTGFAIPTTCTAGAVTVINANSVSLSYTECVTDNFLNAAFGDQVQ